MSTDSIELVVTDGYFDGQRHFGQGPYTIALKDGRIDAVCPGAVADGSAATVRRAAYVLPGLVEAHSHLFLDGGELDADKRSAHLRAPLPALLDAGRASLQQSLAAGVTLVRDAGDIHGVNLALREEARTNTRASAQVICPGTAIRKAGRYGSFMAREVCDSVTIEDLMAELAPGADQFKVLLTGIIDFEACMVKGAPQFDLQEASRITAAARRLGRRTFVHCSGRDGIDIALAAGFDSIEHGFFVSETQLERMAELGTAWVPTFSPVHFQQANPQIAPWGPNAVAGMTALLDGHARRLAQAVALGVPVMPGSDAGSQGVPHGQGLVDELDRMAAAGIPTEQLLRSATSLPRDTWGCASVDIRRGMKAELVLLEASPIDDLRALRKVIAVYANGWLDLSPARKQDPCPVRLKETTSEQ